VPPDRPTTFVSVDDLLPKISVEDVAAYYRVPLPELKRIGDEVRTACFLNCGKARETGDRALAIQAEDPTKRWYCHQYGCGKKGNLVGICDLLKEGENAGGRPRGDRFKQIAADLREMAGGLLSSSGGSPPPANPTIKKAANNVPLAESANERARALVTLDAKFVQDVGKMPPPVSAYFRRRSWLNEELRRKWRVGYLPRDVGGDKAGGTMRGHVVYPLLSEKGEVLTWFGRDPEYEEKHRRWAANGRSGPEPEKFHFVKGFHRGLELFGQHASRVEEPGYRQTLARLGLAVVEGPNDVIRLDSLGVPAVGLLSNVAAAGQVAKISRFARRLARGRVLLMLDCDAEGEVGARQTVYELARHCDVRLAWSPESHGGRFKGRQPEALAAEECSVILGARS
jgi:hypothetical protein